MGSFHQLVDAIDPGIVASHAAPTFHQFTQLPLEIRYQIYESYFHSSPEIVPGNKGIHLTQPRIVLCSQLPERPFLPSLCLVNRALGEEVTSFLARTTIFDVWMRNLMTSRDVCPAQIFTRNLIESSHQYIARNIRFLSFSLDRIDAHRDASTMFGAVHRSKTVLQRLLSRLTGLRELKLVYVAPTHHVAWMPPSSIYTPLHLEELDLSALSHLRNLRRVLIAVRCEADRDVSVGEKEAHLRAISERARQLKFKLRSEVKVFVSFAGCDSMGVTDGEV